MALVVKDRVKETSTTTGTGTLTLAGAVAGFQSFLFIFPSLLIIAFFTFTIIRCNYWIRDVLPTL